MEIIPVQPSDLTVRPADLSDLADSFIADMDISEGSRDTYSRSLSPGWRPQAEEPG